MNVKVGERIRAIRTALKLSLAEVASRAKISIATLSRIERGRQGLDVGLFLILSRLLKTAPRDLIGDTGADNLDPLAVRIAAFNHSERMQLWRDLAEQRDARSRNASTIGDDVEELVAQLEYVRAGMESLRAGVRRR